MKNTELDVLLETLETRSDLTVAEFSGVAQALHYLLPDDVMDDAKLVERLNGADEVMLIADHAFPNWSVHIKGRTNSQNGEWHCTLRENDGRDSDAFIGMGKSPVLSQAILAAVIRVASKSTKTG